MFKTELLNAGPGGGSNIEYIIISSLFFANCALFIIKNTWKTCLKYVSIIISVI